MIVEETLEETMAKFASVMPREKRRENCAIYLITESGRKT